MIQSEELSSKSSGYASIAQDETIRRYCSQIEERIKNAPSKAEAGIIVENACISFEQECLSDLLKNSLETYVTGLLAKHWNKL